MTVNRIRYQNYRNIEDMTLEPSPGVNVVYGENAQGKTNIVEGIWRRTRSWCGSAARSAS